MPSFNYSPEKTILIIGGEVIEGFDPESTISITRPENRVTYHKGIKNGVRVHNPNEHGEVKINLLIGSASNVFLSKMFQDDMADFGQGVRSLRFVSKNAPNGEIDFEATAGGVWVIKETDSIWSGNHEIREWMLESGDMTWKYLQQMSRVEQPEQTA